MATAQKRQTMLTTRHFQTNQNNRDARRTKKPKNEGASINSNSTFDHKFHSLITKYVIHRSHTNETPKF